MGDLGGFGYTVAWNSEGSGAAVQRSVRERIPKHRSGDKVIFGPHRVMWQNVRPKRIRVLAKIL